jgi:protein TonB
VVVVVNKEEFRISRKARARTVGSALSLLLHGCVVALIWGHPPRVTLASDLVDDDLVTVAVAADTPEPPAVDAAPPPPAPTPPPPRPRRPLARPDTVPTPGPVPSSMAVAPPLTPDQPDPDEDIDEDQEEPVEEPAPPPATTETEAPAAQIRQLLLPAAARALRVYDVFPTMPLARRGLASAERARTVEVCVSDRGAVSDAVIDGRSNDTFDRTLRAAILTWRYRPLTVNGRPTPFCHLMRVSYRLY